MDESFLRLKGRKVIGNGTDKCFGRLSDILVNKDTNKIIGIISKNDSFIYRHRLFYMKDIRNLDEVCIYVNGFGEKFVKIIPIYTDFKSCENDIYKRKAIFADGSVAGKIQNVNFDFETGIITGFEVGFSLAQDLLTGRMLCPAQDTINFLQGDIILENRLSQTAKRKKMFF